MDDLSVELNELLVQMLEDEIELIRLKLVHWPAGNGGIIRDPETNDFCSVTSECLRLDGDRRPGVSGLRRDRRRLRPPRCQTTTWSSRPRNGARVAAVVDGGTAFATDSGRNVGTLLATCHLLQVCDSV